METKTWIVNAVSGRILDGRKEEVKAVSCDVGNKALVFRKGAGLGEKDGVIVRAFSHGTWKDVKLKDSKDD